MVVYLHMYLYAMFHSSGVNVYACSGRSPIRNTVTKLGNMVSVYSTYKTVRNWKYIFWRPRREFERTPPPAYRSDVHPCTYVLPHSCCSFKIGQWTWIDTKPPSIVHVSSLLQSWTCWHHYKTASLKYILVIHSSFASWHDVFWFSENTLFLLVSEIMSELWVQMLVVTQWVEYTAW